MNQTVHSRRAPPAARSPGRALQRAERDARRAALADVRAPKPPATRTQDPQAVQADILEAAIAEFGEKGLAGARVDAIAAATRTSKRMIYYYFGGKDELYLAALEESYRRVRTREMGVSTESMAPMEAMRCLVALTYDHNLANEHYVRMVMSENINRGRYLARSPHIQELNRPAIAVVQRIYERGVAEGVFRPGLDPADLHATISALAFFNVSNRHTFGLIFQIDNQSPAYIAARRESVVQTVLRYVSQS